MPTPAAIRRLLDAKLLVYEFGYRHWYPGGGYYVAKPTSVPGNNRGDDHSWGLDVNVDDIRYDGPRATIYPQDKKWIFEIAEYAPGPGPGDFEMEYNSLDDAVSAVIEYYFGDPSLMNPPEVVKRKATFKLRMWESIKEDETIPGSTCKRDDCDNERMELGMFCRAHHYEEVMGELPPATEPLRVRRPLAAETSTMPTLDSISLNFPGWELHQREDTMAVWVDADGDALGIDFFNLKPNIPAPRNGPDALRDYFRQEAVATGGGIVEVDTVEIHGIDCARLIMKFRQESTGFMFQGGCVVPRQNFSYVVRVQCPERGATGMREAAIMVIEMPDREYEDVPEDAAVNPLFAEAEWVGKIKGWFKDPYDCKHDESALYSLADQQKYDDSFPNHPLSRARRKLERVIETLEFTSEIVNAAEFDGPE